MGILCQVQNTRVDRRSALAGLSSHDIFLAAASTDLLDLELAREFGPPWTLGGFGGALFFLGRQDIVGPRVRGS